MALISGINTMLGVDRAWPVLPFAAAALFVVWAMLG